MSSPVADRETPSLPPVSSHPRRRRKPAYQKAGLGTWTRPLAGVSWDEGVRIIGECVRQLIGMGVDGLKDEDPL